MKKTLILLLLPAILLFSCNNSKLPTSFDFVPMPNDTTYVSNQAFHFNKHLTISATTENDFNAEYLKKHLDNLFAFKTKVDFSESGKSQSPTIFLRLINSEEAKNEYNLDDNSDAYSLRVDGAQKYIIIVSTTTKGIFYGIQTLFQMLPPEIYSDTPAQIKRYALPSYLVTDSPRFQYRGFMQDVSRTFFDVAYMKKLIDAMAYHKLNYLHWHLTDDNGWRIELKSYPKLTEMAAWRGEHEILKPTYGSGMKRNGGFYTQEEIRDIVHYASDRGITIIPEIDLPGHSKAVTVCYPDVFCNTDVVSLSVQFESNNVWCVGNEHNYVMLDSIFGELTTLFPSPIYHIGGDEVNMNSWKNCPRCQTLMHREGITELIDVQNYFVSRMEKILKKHGKSLGGWDEITDGDSLMPTSVVYAWRDLAKGIESVKKGQPTVMQICNYLYFDMKQSPDERGLSWAGIVPLEMVYNFDPIGAFNLNEHETSLVLGPQGGLWGECLQYPDRIAEYQTFPKMCALSEIAWSDRKTHNYGDFHARLDSSHLSRLDNMDLAFRVSPPEVIYEGGCLEVDKEFNDLEIRYTTDKTSPTKKSNLYTGLIATEQPENYRFACFYKERSSISRGAKNITLYHYLYPETQIETNIPSDQNIDVLTDKNPWSVYLSKRPLQKDDYMIFTFDQPVSCSSISVLTGYHTLTLYGIPNGYIEYSYNGIDYIRGSNFDLDMVDGYKASINPDKPVKSIKLIVTGIGDGLTGIIQDLVIIQ